MNVNSITSQSGISTTDYYSTSIQNSPLNELDQKCAKVSIAIPSINILIIKEPDHELKLSKLDFYEFDGSDADKASIRRMLDEKASPLQKNAALVKSIRFSRFMDDAFIEEIISKCPNLTSVDLSFRENITDAAVVALAENCPDLIIVFV